MNEKTLDTQTSPAPVQPPKKRFSVFRDIVGIIVFVVSVIIGAFVLNAFVFQTYNVFGPSMEPTLQTGDRLVVNKLPATWERVRGQQYVPPRGQVIVFFNPLEGAGGNEQHLVKRVIGLPGERVVVENGVITVFNDEFPGGFEPDKNLSGPKSPTSGSIVVNVPNDAIFVAGDNRVDSFSLDSRNGLGAVPLDSVEGPVYARIFPFSQFKFF